jgi:hypothetical protein
MSHCPQCGELTPEGARACPFCGSLLAAAPARPTGGGRPQPSAPGSRTIVGVSARDILPAQDARPQPAVPSKVNLTMVGVSAKELPGQVGQTPGAQPPAPSGANRAGAHAIGHTIVGMAASSLGTAKPGISPSKPVVPAPPAGAPRQNLGTLLGVALPGIAPLAPGQEPPVAPQDAPVVPPRPPAPPGYQPAGELGATMGPGAVPDAIVAQLREHERDKRRRRVIAGGLGAPRQRNPVKAEDDGASRRALAVVLTAGGLALTAVLVALFWPSPPPLTALARADSAGKEGVELVCKSCPDGTKLTISGATAITAGGVALVPLPTALLVGENRLKVSIDRPGNGRDETIAVSLNVAYRIRPDLTTLQSEKPAFQILAEVASGTAVTIDGRKMAISGGRGVENVDVTDVCTGLSNEVKTLSRQIPYVVTPESGPPEQGVVNVAVGIVPLHLDAPVAIASTSLAPHVITDGPSFLLAGWTMKGAEVFAAGRPIPVLPDGSFAQVMNVSSPGATQIEVRARMPGMAPRLTQIKVRRVDSLEKVARELASTEPPIPFAQLAADIPAAAGKAVALAGEVSETKKQGHETVMLLEVSAASGCPTGNACTVRLVQGGDNPAKRGDSLRVYGHVARAFSVPGRADIPEIEVDFTLKGEPSGTRDRK